MELMSSLLLCALIAFLPQALGESRKTPPYYDAKFNDAILIKRKMGSIGTNIILNKNSVLHGKIGDVQSIFIDPTCKGCRFCMEHAVKAHKSNIHMVDHRISSEDFHHNRNSIDMKKRNKRNANNWNEDVKKSKRSKPKKNRGTTVNKYYNNSKIYALKINDTNTIFDSYNNSKTVMTCQVYSVKKSVTCDSPEANLILTGSRKKTNKKGKKGLDKRETKSVEPLKIIEPAKKAEPIKRVIIAPVYRKRNIDDSQVPEQIMPSIEEMY